MYPTLFYRIQNNTDMRCVSPIIYTEMAFQKSKMLHRNHYGPRYQEIKLVRDSNSSDI